MKRYLPPEVYIVTIRERKAVAIINDSGTQEPET